MSNFNYILTLMKSGSQKLKQDDPMLTVIQNLEKLNNQILQLNLLEEDPQAEEHTLKPHKMNKQEFRNLMTAYDDLKKSARLAHKYGGRTVHQQLMGEMMQMVNRDLEALHRVDPENLADYHTMVEDSAHYTADISGKNLDRVGGSSSNRFPMSVANGKGGYVDGYFTADSRLIPDVIARDAIKDAMRACSDNPVLCAALKNLSKGTMDSISHQLFGPKVNFNTRDQDLEKFTPSDNMPTVLLDAVWKQSLGINDRLGLTEDQAKSLYTMVNQIYSTGFTRAFSQDCAGIPEGGVIGQRNAAMSAVADYLGVPELIARSNQISVLTGYDKEGKAIYRNGTFMEKVKGITLSGIQRHEVQQDIIDVDISNDTVKKAATNLQVLDYICGNVDRHPGNYFFTSEIRDNVIVFTGIVGIDNDASFGILKTDQDNHLLRCPANMGYIDQRMADKVKNMTKDDLQQILAGFGIRGREISAAWDRVQALQEAITTNKIQTVAEEEWNTISLNKMDEANRRETKSSYSLGIGTVCQTASSKLYHAYSHKKALVDDAYREFADEYKASHPDLQTVYQIPQADQNKLKEKALFVTEERIKAEKGLQTDESPIMDYISQAVYQANNENGWNIDPDEVDTLDELKKTVCEGLAEDMYLASVKKKALEEWAEREKDPVAYDAAHKAPAKAPAKNGDDLKMTALTGRAARLANVENRLEDIKTAFDATLKDHGMSKECRLMNENMNRLLEMTKSLKEKEAQDPGHYSAEDWGAYEKQLKETLDASCFYISKKSANPIHQYGKDRLDAAHQLRTATLSALQMAQDEITAKKTVQDPDLSKFRAKDTTKEKSLTAPVKDQKVKETNSSSLIK